MAKLSVSYQTFIGDCCWKIYSDFLGQPMSSYAVGFQVEEESFCCRLCESILTGWLTAQTFSKMLIKTRAEIYV